MANYVQISGFNAYPARRYSTRTITQIDPYLYLGHYVKFSYDFNYYQELIRILKEGGSFEQKEKNNEKPTIFTFDKDKLELTVNSPINRRLSLTYKLNQEVVNEIIELVKDDVKNTMADDVFREALKAANAKERLIKHRNKSKIVPETAPESPKDDLPSMPKSKEESFTTDQINDNNDSVVNIVSETAPESPKEEKVEETKPNEELLTTAQKNDNNDYVNLETAIDTILKVEGLSKEDLNKKENFSKKFAIYGLMYPTQAKQFENRYKIKVSVDTYVGLRKFFE